MTSDIEGTEKLWSLFSLRQHIKRLNRLIYKHLNKMIYS